MNHGIKAVVTQLQTGLHIILGGKAMVDFGLVRLAGAPKEVCILLFMVI